ncbi:cell division protein SepF [Salinicoccus sesuvii]|uniref:Cell division protein SepF n=1 Tax=Salinicoccus sesuvii TaxID=868281 RepID=A0ABV7N7M9_9STAP
MAIKKFFKDIFIVEYEEDDRAKESKKQPATSSNMKVTSLEESKKGRTQNPSVETPPTSEEKETTPSNHRKTERKKPVRKRPEKDRKTIQNEKETTLMSAEASNTKVCLFEPRVFSETQDIADELKNERATLVNLTKVEQGPKKRIVDFLSGTVYAMDGDIQKVGTDIFLCTPNSVSVEGEISEGKNQIEEM